MGIENENPDGAGEDLNTQESGGDNADNGKPDGEGKPEQGGQPSNDQGDESGGDNAGDKPNDGSDKSDNDQSVGYSDFDFPEGMEINQELLNDVTPIMQEAGLTQEQAQKMVSAYASHVEGQNQGQIEAHNAQVKQWGEELKADKEIGGDNYEENMAVARQAVEKFGSEEFVKFLDQTGLGNHPEMGRLLVKVGKLTQEDSPGNSGAGAGEEQDIAKRWYKD
jgi:hypothetical protein